MPRAKPSDPVATAAAPRVARPRRTKPKPLDPVLAGFARLAETAVPAEAPPPELITPPTPPLPVPAGDWHRLNLFACLFAAVLVAALLAGGHFRSIAANPAHAAILTYAALCDSEIVDPLRTANDGTLTGEAALKLIETARPVIQRHTWSDLAEQLTALQDADGNLPQAETAAFLDTVSTGLRSVR